MAKGCISRTSDKTYLSIKKRINDALGQDKALSDEKLIDAINLYAAKKGVSQIEALDYPDELNSFLNETFNIKEEGVIHGKIGASKAQTQLKPIKDVQAEGQMKFKYGKQKRDDVKSSSTIEAILNGERTATTRYSSDKHISYWQKLKVGDIVRFYDTEGNEVFVEITNPLTKLSNDTNPEEWSKKEGWSVDYFNKNVLPKIDEAYQMEYKLLDDKAETQSKPTKIEKKKKTLEDHIKDTEDMIEFFSEKIQRGKGETEAERNADFKKNHKYYLNGKAVDMSVTEFIRKDKSQKKSDLSVEPWLYFGNTFDSFVRDFFDGGLKGFYPNLTRANIDLLKGALTGFKQSLDKKFGEGKYRVITSEFPIGGEITINGVKKTIAGTIDMMVVTDKGERYIYDMKTTKNDELDDITITEYSKQTTLYKELISASFPEMAKSFKGLGLLVARTSYPSPARGEYAVKNKKDPSFISENQIYFKGKPVQDYSDSGIVLRAYDKNGNYIMPITANAAIQKLDISGLDREDAAAAEELMVKKLTKAAASKEQPYTGPKIEMPDTSDDVTYDIENGYRKLSASELTWMGKTLMKRVSEIADRLKADDSFRAEYFDWEDVEGKYKENYFTSKDRNAILRDKDVFGDILMGLRKDFFKINYDSPAFDKAMWVADNFWTVINRGYATLLEMEDITLSSTGIIESVDGLPESVLDAYNMFEREYGAKEAYTIESKEVEGLVNANVNLRRALMKIRKRDEYGNEVTDKYGYGLQEYYDVREIYAYLTDKLGGFESSSQMVAKLEELDGEVPFISDILNIVNSSPRMKTYFFNLMRKNKSNYFKTYSKSEQKSDGFGGYYTKTTIETNPVAENATIEESFNDYRNNIIAGVDAFNSVGNNLLGMSTVDKYIIEDDLSIIDEIKQNDSTRDKARKLSNVLETLGIDDFDAVKKMAKHSAQDFARLKKDVKNFLSTLNSVTKEIVPYSDFYSKYRNIAEKLAKYKDVKRELISHDGDKNYQENTDPTFLQTLIERLNNRNEVDEEEYLRYFEDNFDRFRQYTLGNEYVSSWLTRLHDDEESREILKHYIKTSTDTKPYRKQGRYLFAKSILTSYFSPLTDKRLSKNVAKELALYIVPPQSDKPSEEYIRFYKTPIDLAEEGFGLEEMKDKLSNEAYKFFLFELDRIKSVFEQLKRNQDTDIENIHFKRSKVPDTVLKKIQDGKPLVFGDIVKDGKFLPYIYDGKAKTGAMFQYISDFNDELTQKTEFGKSILAYLNGNKRLDLTGLKSDFINLYKEKMELAYQSFLNDFPISLNDFQRMFRSKLEITSKKEADAYMQEVFWNSEIARYNIFNLTIVDPAFNKNTADLVKRFAQTHSSTSKPDIDATFMLDGVETKFSDGINRFVVIEDNEFSNKKLADDIEKVFIAKMNEAKLAGDEKEAQNLKYLSKMIPDMFRESDAICETDGQAFSSPTGFFKKYGMLGLLTDDMEEAWNEIRKGNFKIEHFQTLFQPIKPYAFGNIIKSESSFNGGEMVIPTQVKDSEYMLTLAGAILQHSNENNILKVLYDIMEESAFLGREHVENITGLDNNLKDGNIGQYTGSGIDAFVFHSTIKQGATGVINVNDFKSYKEAKAAIEGKIYADKTSRTYNETFVQHMPYILWGKQQNVPAHLLDHEQGMGSQFRVLVVADIPNNITVTLKDGSVVSAEKFKHDYFDLITKDFNIGISKVRAMFGLDLTDKVNDDGTITTARQQRNKLLSDLLSDNIVKDSKYTDEMRKAFLAINGEFPIPLGDPVLAEKFFKVIFSAFKKKVNNEEMFGGPTVQITSFGISKDLKIHYNREGDPTSGIKNIDIYITAPSDEIEKAITKKDGSLMTVQEALDAKVITEEQLETILYRIPTEDSYSIYKAKIKGFLPRRSGEAICLPAELVKLAGWDFDRL